jgi:hypothetical protein
MSLVSPLLPHQAILEGIALQNAATAWACRSFRTDDDGVVKISESRHDSPEPSVLMVVVERMVEMVLVVPDRVYAADGRVGSNDFGSSPVNSNFSSRSMDC